MITSVMGQARNGFQTIRRRLGIGRHERVIVANTAWLTLALGLAGIADFLVVVYVTRVFGASGYGQFAFALAFASLFSAFYDFGLATAVTREFARDNHRPQDLAALLVLKGLLGAVVLVPIAIGAFLLSPSPVVRLAILIMSLHVILLEALNLFYAYFRSRQRMDVEAKFRLLYVLLLVSFVVVTVSIRPSIVVLALAYLGGSLCTLVVLIAALTRAEQLLRRPVLNPAVWRTFLRIGAYLALSKVAGDLIVYAGPVMLGALGKLTETGWYNAGAKINGFVLLPMSLIGTATFPTLVSIRSKSIEDFRKYWTTWGKAMAVLAVFLCAVMLANASAVVAVVYPSDFGPAAAVLQVLIMSAALIYLYAPYYYALLILDKQRELFRSVLVGSAAGVTANAILIPRFGPVGAAWGLVTTHAVIFLLLALVALRDGSVRKGSKELVTTVVGAIVAGGLMIVSLWMLRNAVTNLVLAAVVGAVVYLVVLTALVSVRRMLVTRRAATTVVDVDERRSETEP